MKVLVTAGPTREPIDPVRYLGNRSSGRMGYAIAEALAGAGHEVRLVSGPVNIDAPSQGSVSLTRVETAQEMFEAVEKQIAGTQLAIFCAAVADFRPKAPLGAKIKKSGLSELRLELEPTPDILGSARGPFGFKGALVGFAAETNELETYARSKLKRKDCDLIIANDVSRTDIGFDQESNELQLYFADGTSEHLPRSTKRELAAHLLPIFESLVANRPS